MFRNIIAPVQAWLISQGRCVGCSNPLSEGKSVKFSENENKVTCIHCGRVFLYNTKTKKYKRAPIEK